MNIPWTVECLDKTDSTQAVLKRQAMNGAAEGVVVQAWEQEGGKGRHGRIWTSPPGNLYMSFLLRPQCNAAGIGQLSVLISVAAYDAVSAFADNLSLKWPNDLLIQNKKCAGILLETEIDEQNIAWLAVGIGVNVNSAPEDGVCVQGTEVDTLRDKILDSVSLHYDAWKEDKYKGIEQKWLDAAHPKDTKMEIKLGKRLEQGYFHGLDENGNMLLRDDDNNLRTISAGDVYLV